MRLSVSKKQLSYSEKEFGEHRERFVLTDYITKLTQSVSLISVPRPDVRYICKDSELYMSSGSGYTKDDFSHEQSVIIRSEGGVNIISPCSHTGIINIINRARELTGEKILNVVGGLHMQGRGGKNEINCDRAFIEETAAYLFKNVNGKVYTGHCTGIAAYEILKSIMGDKIEYLSTGNTIEI
jgi:7,8-dihydropterin-6-yl-methyl-4-(beta-D-ribofuranosyl)aminobenzene 5'-phosphate synthase